MTATALRYVEEFKPGCPTITPEFDEAMELRMVNWGHHVRGGLPFYGSNGIRHAVHIDCGDFTEWLICRTRALAHRTMQGYPKPWAPIVMVGVLKIHYADRPHVYRDAADDLARMTGVGSSERTYFRWLKRARKMMAFWFFLYPLVPEEYFKVRRRMW